jgi:hypothetical protein
MTTPIAPHLLRGGIVQIDVGRGNALRIIVLQYNPDTVTRTMQVKGVGENADRSEALRLRGPAVETIKLEAEIDATDMLERADGRAITSGIHGQLATLELLVQPTSAQIQANATRAGRGELEIVPMQTPLVLFVWSSSRVVPVRVTELSITEEAFDPALNPIRAKVSLGLRTLSVDDLGISHRGSNLFLSYLRTRESLATSSGALAALGLTGIP